MPLFIELAAYWLAFNVLVAFDLRTLNRHYAENGRPLRCTDCGAADAMQEVVIDAMDGRPCEVSTHCERCGTVAGYWAYGHYEPFFRDEYRRRLLHGSAAMALLPAALAVTWYLA